MLTRRTWVWILWLSCLDVRRRNIYYFWHQFCNDRSRGRRVRHAATIWPVDDIGWPTHGGTSTDVEPFANICVGFLIPRWNTMYAAVFGKAQALQTWWSSWRAGMKWMWSLSSFCTISSSSVFPYGWVLKASEMPTSSTSRLFAITLTTLCMRYLFSISLSYTKLADVILELCRLVSCTLCVLFVEVSWVYGYNSYGVEKEKQPSYLLTSLPPLFDAITVVDRCQAWKLFAVFWRARFVAGGDSYLSASLNSFVHVLMYSHYLATALGAGDLWWKPYLTRTRKFFFRYLIHSRISDGAVFLQLWRQLVCCRWFYLHRYDEASSLH